MSTDKNQQLRQAVKNGDEDEVKRLVVDEHADIDAKTTIDGVTSLLWAVYYGHEGVVRLLHGLGANLAVKTYDGRTPLHLAAYYGEMDVVRLLHSFGADIEANDILGRTPLHYIACSDREDVVRLLHSLGADFDAKNNDGETPRDVALKRNKHAIVRIFDELRNSPAMRRINILARPRPPVIGGEIYVDTVEASGGVAAYWAQCCGVTSGDIAHILSFLDDSSDYAQARLVCKTWRRLADTTLESRSDEFF